MTVYSRKLFNTRIYLFERDASRGASERWPIQAGKPARVGGGNLKVRERGTCCLALTRLLTERSGGVVAVQECCALCRERSTAETIALMQPNGGQRKARALLSEGPLATNRVHSREVVLRECFEHLLGVSKPLINHCRAYPAIPEVEVCQTTHLNIHKIAS